MSFANQVQAGCSDKDQKGQISGWSYELSLRTLGKDQAGVTLFLVT